MGKHATTIRDVAAAAGVAPMTVSNALHGRPGVSESTRQKVLETAGRLHYRINPSASMLKSGRSGIIHIVVNDFDAPFYSKLVATLSTAIAGRGLVPFPQQTRYSPQVAEHALANSQLGQQLFDGQILHAQGISADRQLLSLTAGRPTVLIDSCQPHPVVNAIEFPNAMGARAAMLHLIERGCRRIAVVGIGQGASPETSSNRDASLNPDTPFNSDAHQQRCDAALATLAEHGLAHDESVIFEGRDEEQGVVAGHAIADSSLHFDGVWCTNDSGAIGVIRGLADRSLHVPQDLKVIGFDGVSEGSYSVPTLSTVATDMHQLAELALDMLIRSIEHPENTFTPTIATVGFTLLARESTA